MSTKPTVSLSVPRGRPRWHSYLLLARISNLPTVWTNVVAGMIAASTVLNDAMLFARMGAAASCFYVGGMFLNDAFDAGHDARVRPERPIPAGDVSRREVFAVGGGLLVLGLALLPPDAAVLLIGLVLTVCILFYDYRHKGSRSAPLVMGLCRGLLYLLAAAALGSITSLAWAGALVVTAYVTGLSLVGRAAGRHAAYLVPALIAAISLVDAVFITIISGASLVPVAVAIGCPATLLLQRVIPGD